MKSAVSNLFSKSKTPKAITAEDTGGGSNQALMDMIQAKPLTTGAVPPHGDEAHTGGGGGGTAIGQAVAGGIAGGAGGGGVFNVGDAVAGLEGLDRQGEEEYMAQFDKNQLARIKKHQSRQRMANQTGRAFFGVEPNKPKSSFGF
jgi:hypothetical protein